VSLIVFASPHSCVAEWLAGVAARDDVHGLDCCPIHLRYVAEVRHAGVVGFHDAAGRRVNLGVPGQVATDGHI
jgi:hypothetical protein